LFFIRMELSGALPNVMTLRFTDLTFPCLITTIWAMLIIDTNNKAWLKYVGQNTGNAWTIVNGTEVSAVPQIRIFHLDVFSICKVDFRFAFPLATPPAQNVQPLLEEEINLGESQSPVLEEIQVLPDAKEETHVEMDENETLSLDLNVDIQELDERKSNLLTSKSQKNVGSSQNEEIHVAEKISQIGSETIEDPLPNMDDVEVSTKKKKKKHEKKSSKVDDSIEVIRTNKSPKVINIEEDEEEPLDENEPEEEPEIQAEELKNSALQTPKQTRKRSLSISESTENNYSDRPPKRHKRKWYSKTWERYWTPTSEKRRRRRCRFTCSLGNNEFI